MVYKWKIPSLYSVSAETAGAELNRIYEKNGELKPADIVEESRPESAPLHQVFEWDDEKAAEQYRIEQARHMLCAIVRVETPERRPPQEIRAFIHAEKVYHPARVVLEHPNMREEAFKDALRSMESFKQKYCDFAELTGVIVEMDKILDQNKSYPI